MTPETLRVITAACRIAFVVLFAAFAAISSAIGLNIAKDARRIADSQENVEVIAERQAIRMESKHSFNPPPLKMEF